MNIRAQSVPASGAYLPPPSSSISVASIASSPTTGAVVSKKKSNPRKKESLRTIVFSKNPSEGDMLGSLSIPALSQTMPIIEGTGTDDLKKGVGHYMKSVLPGQKDNCVLSGHRDTFFARLGELKTGDRVTVATAAGTYFYQVQRIRIVDKHDRTVIVPTNHGVLTLSTCYPFNYVGAAPRRYIVSADLVASN